MKKERKESRVYLSTEVEHIPGFCPVCLRPVDIIITEDPAELFGICGECGNTLFYSNKMWQVVEALTGEGDFE